MRTRTHTCMGLSVLCVDASFFVIAFGRKPSGACVLPTFADRLRFLRHLPTVARFTLALVPAHGSCACMCACPANVRLLC